MGRSTLMTQLFGQAQDVVTIATFAVGLLLYAPWLIVLLLLALVPAFLGEAHFNAPATRSTTRARRSAARSTTSGRPAPASRRPRK
jgi:ABC-type bacteriocin/lantibiotic exporter with double-glycine peptidase domain